MNETESSPVLFERLMIFGAVAAFLFAPAILFIVRGDLIGAAISFLSPAGIILAVESGLYNRFLH